MVRTYLIKYKDLFPEFDSDSNKDSLLKPQKDDNFNTDIMFI